MHRIFVCGWFAWWHGWHGWWRRPSFGLGTWSRSPLLLLFMGTSVRRNILLKDSYSSIILAQWKVLFTLLKDYVALFHRILFHVHWVNVQVLPQYCISYPNTALLWLCKTPSQKLLLINYDRKTTSIWGSHLEYYPSGTEELGSSMW